MSTGSRSHASYFLAGYGFLPQIFRDHESTVIFSLHLTWIFSSQSWHFMNGKISTYNPPTIPRRIPVPPPWKLELTWTQWINKYCRVSRCANWFRIINHSLSEYGSGVTLSHACEPGGSRLAYYNVGILGCAHSRSYATWMKGIYRGILSSLFRHGGAASVVLKDNHHTMPGGRFSFRSLFTPFQIEPD